MSFIRRNENPRRVYTIGKTCENRNLEQNGFVRKSRKGTVVIDDRRPPPRALEGPRWSDKDDESSRTVFDGGVRVFGFTTRTGGRFCGGGPTIFIVRNSSWSAGAKSVYCAFVSRGTEIVRLPERFAAISVPVGSAAKSEFRFRYCPIVASTRGNNSLRKNKRTLFAAGSAGKSYRRFRRRDDAFIMQRYNNNCLLPTFLYLLLVETSPAHRRSEELSERATVSQFSFLHLTPPPTSHTSPVTWRLRRSTGT